MSIIDILTKDYKNFPKLQSFEIYADDVVFSDPLTSFKGVERYQKMIKFMDSFFSDINLELHAIEQEKQLIKTEWTLTMSSPLPWKPVMTISGSSELVLNNDLLIVSHRDYWQISPWQVLVQNFRVSLEKGI